MIPVPPPAERGGTSFGAGYAAFTAGGQDQLTDETSGGSFTSPPERYNGPANTAEWVVETPSLCRQRCQPAFLAPYTPDIVFSHLGITGHETSLERITLVQQSDAVATPPPLDGDEFRVAYTGPTAFY